MLLHDLHQQDASTTQQLAELHLEQQGRSAETSISVQQICPCFSAKHGKSATMVNLVDNSTTLLAGSSLMISLCVLGLLSDSDPACSVA